MENSRLMANIHSDNYYEVMGINKDATIEVIRKTYRILAMKWHPVSILACYLLIH